MDGTGKQNDGSDRRGTKRDKFLADDDSSKSSTSSIGTPNDSGEDEVEGNSNPRTGLDSLDSLQDSLPIKKGLSSHFDGKSKSFTDLSSANELKKQENPANKRRRILTSSRWSRRASLCNCPDPNSMPLLPLPEEQDDDDKEEEKCGEQLASPSSSSRPPSSSLTEEKKQEDDQQHDEEKKESDEDEEDA